MTSRLTHLECARCGETHDAHVLQGRCGCGVTLLARYDLAPLDLGAVRARPAGLWRYRELLPVAGGPISLGEPATALLSLPRLSERWGVELFVKDDALLPGATFKARGAAVALSRAVELGVTDVVMPTAGNAGGAWSLYAARAGIAITVTMARTAPAANQAEVLTAGGILELVDGTIADAAHLARALADGTGAFLAATFSEPYRLEGKKSCWLEAFDELGEIEDRGGPMRAPATIVLPVGGGVAAIAAAKAAAEARSLGWLDDQPPVLVGAQPDRCAPIVRAFERGDTEVEPWADEPDTIAAGLRVPAPSEGSLVLDYVRASHGSMHAASEDEILGAVREVASTEGVFLCPEAGAAASVAGRLAAAGQLKGPALLYNTAAGAKYAAALARAGA